MFNIAELRLYLLVLVCACTICLGVLMCLCCLKLRLVDDAAEHLLGTLPIKRCLLVSWSHACDSLTACNELST